MCQKLTATHQYKQQGKKYFFLHIKKLNEYLYQLSDQLNTPPRRSWTGFAVAILLFTCAIVAVLGYWLLKQRGVL